MALTIISTAALLLLAGSAVASPNKAVGIHERATSLPASTILLPASSTTSSSASAATTLGHVPAVGNYSWIGCYTEATDARALSNAAKVNYTSMTVEICAEFCTPLFSMFGLEYGGECYCGDLLQQGSVPASTTDCNMACDGNQYEYCGAGNRLDVYRRNGTAGMTGTTTPADPPSTGVSSTGTVASSATTTGKVTSAATGLPAGWKYDGCYIDNAHGRILNHQQSDSQTNTVEICVNACIGLGYTIAGMEYSSQCFCDDNLYNGAALTAGTDCNMACSGNSSEICGAGSRMSIYNTGKLTAYQVPAPQTTDLPGSWNYSGCYTDNVNQTRALLWQIILTNNNSATNCLGLCSEYGYMTGGMEYGEECYCGDLSDLEASGSTLQADSECTTPCSGNATTICGDGNRLSLYNWIGTPLYVWNKPTDYHKGSYQFLIGGVVVPLITSVAINGKVTFLEKHGTGEPNGTGAYELDLSEINDFSAAWRTMHLQTDVFCAAGLTLPDKVGRQINVGGWSGQSTFGVRLYWPDGSAGVPGTNDWQENVNEVTLQAGRWYPSAMIMANGSILVVGGEVGSNSAPTPSLEILPNPPGGRMLYMEWLNRTDPNNLYPFLYVLPSGGIFVGYYNEARILDPVTFATIKQLPNMPGTVQSFLAGRTYPLEGTAMILPQHAPYTDPVTVLVCGGSTTGAGMAIDNCISTQPEAADPEWVIERMPYQRVMSCMTALPDGTYLILNGAFQGVAGFGLATRPNLGALLYDPTKSVTQRMTVMATTIVARMYHSEAILLPDGRVMVSGSDPEDDVNPEEYRVEQFLPPYLLSGLARPSYTISNTDWSYGQSVTIKVSIPSGATPRASLMGAVASTHGNSMGQRTLFPAISCSGTTCTITAPPNANVSPPGWFQLFVLDGPTPSNATWVRIGGDPAGLGNWPNFTDFNVPGV
ncbi:MAG: hypothetical protein M1818_001022 [Claussenomyces sp. TS43310]|nr:MAG: hypothetical protein M1818_001022 [Claussenomyces sp. TS43310]